MDMQKLSTLDKKKCRKLAEILAGVKEIIVLSSIKKYHRYDKINFARAKKWSSGK
jgi:hypothetical protein